ncbi:MAG: aminotransferase class III-fold pyridoxal phosphate-dependent enzyme [Rhodospirillaceae bacterium]|nr:aminotransferase class III-fold pyridoxal phosphate-dependent enzyme [Rhodospirillaceae bacterium]MBT4587642.1 aminotransferase class III-fold pyridoxal phosphate-dependent enzyme [Rhodospirillaceae bacterium]
MPFTANAGFKADPRMIQRAKGMYYYDAEDRQILDSCSGLYTHAAGHSHPKIVEAVEKQLKTLDYAMAFQFGHPGAFELAERVADLTPGNLNKIFYTNSGSEAVETSLKIALAYHAARGESQRTRFVGREKGYHGVNFGGLSVGGIARNKNGFGPGLPHVHHMRNAYLSESRFTKGQPSEGWELADDLEQIVQTYGADTIAACIVEPIAGSAGIFVPPEGYLQRLRKICDRYGILLIFDEVICGFGRTGKAFGAHSFDVTPDIITMAKALTNGTIPMGAVACDTALYDAIAEGKDENVVELFHGYTYSGHPVACAAGLATLQVYEDEKLFERAEEMAGKFRDLVFSLNDLNIVRDIRSYGLLAGIDLEPGDKPGDRGYDLMKTCFEEGMVLRTSGDTFVLAPALIAEEGQLEEMIAIIRKSLAKWAA